MKFAQGSLPLSLNALLLSQPQSNDIKDVCSLQAAWSSKPTLFTNLSSGIDFSSASVAGILAGGDADPANSPVAGTPSRVPDRSQRATGPGIKTDQRARELVAPAKQCPSPPVLSCSALAASTDACCVQKPGGVLVHTQFWDTDEGVQDSWGVHGLWPDQCNGAEIENCDSSRKYSGAQIVAAMDGAGLQSTLDFMDTHWVSNDESPEDFWAHEWSTHGTCVSTLEPQCFDGYQTAQETALYFDTVVNLFQKLDTYQALSQAEITPSSSKTYTLQELTKAVQSASGYNVDFVCTNSRKTLSQIQYYLHAQGPVQDGEFVESNPTRSGTCDSTGLKYPPKTVGNGGNQGSGQRSETSHKRHGSWRDRRHHGRHH